MTAAGLLQRQQVARLLHELRRPAAAALIAQLPVGLGQPVAPELVRQRSGLSIKDFWTTVARLQSIGLLARGPDGLVPVHDHLDRLIDDLIADSPLIPAIAGRPRLRSFIDCGRIVRMPVEPELIEELYAALAGIFRPGETLSESAVNDRIASAHDDPAEIRRGLVDRGLLVRRPDGSVYHRPEQARRPSGPDRTE